MSCGQTTSRWCCSPASLQAVCSSVIRNDKNTFLTVSHSKTAQEREAGPGQPLKTESWTVPGVIMVDEGRWRPRPSCPSDGWHVVVDDALPRGALILQRVIFCCIFHAHHNIPNHDIRGERPPSQPACGRAALLTDLAD